MKRILRSRKTLQKFQQGGMPQMGQQMPMGMGQMPQGMQQMPQGMQQMPEEEGQMIPPVLLDENNEQVDQYDDQLAVQSYAALESRIRTFLNDNMLRPKSVRTPEDSPFNIEPGTDTESLNSLTNAITEFIANSSSQMFTGKPVKLDEVRDQILSEVGLDIFDIEGIDQIYGGLTGFGYLMENEFTPAFKIQTGPNQYRNGGYASKKILKSRTNMKKGTSYFSDIASSYR